MRLLHITPANMLESCVSIFLKKYHGITVLLEIMNVNYFIYKKAIYYLVYFPIAYGKVENINKHQGI